MSTPEDSRPVLADGRFDPLHAGHVRYLRAARRRAEAEGRRLVVRVSPEDGGGARPAVYGPESRAEVVRAIAPDALVIVDATLAAAIRRMRPAAALKGADWRGRLPRDVIDAARDTGTAIEYWDDPQRMSATGALRAWREACDEAALGRLQAAVATREPIGAYDEAYWRGAWRGDEPYTMAARRRIEGQHPDIIARLWPGLSICDWGAGGGYLAELLAERGCDVYAYEPSAAARASGVGTSGRVTIHAEPPAHSDVVICREVLEHVPLGAYLDTLRAIFACARRYVYITTRFYASALSALDVTDERDVDPTHCTLLTLPMLRALCVLCGGQRRADLEAEVDWQRKGRALVYEVRR